MSDDKIARRAVPKGLEANAGMGRPKGVPNKLTKAAKVAFQEAFEGLGGVPALVTWGKANKSEFFKLYGRLIPLDHQHSGAIGTFDAAKYTNAELDDLERALLPLAAASDDPEGGAPGEGAS